MKIGILGTGDVGRVLGKGFIQAGHEVKIGSRSPQNERVMSWLKDVGSERASAGTFEEAAAFGEVLVLATLWAGTENALQLAGPQNTAGKVVLDATNPLVFTATGPALERGHTDSGGEQVQRWLPEARVVKAFNIVGNPHMVQPAFPGGPPDMFIAGNDAEAKQVVSGLCAALGWSTIDLGGIEASRYLEPLAMIWITHFMRTRSGDHAFKLLRK